VLEEPFKGVSLFETALFLRMCYQPHELSAATLASTLGSPAATLGSLAATLGSLAATLGSPAATLGSPAATLGSLACLLLLAHKLDVSMVQELVIATMAGE
jgi:hypothetical protein